MMQVTRSTIVMVNKIQSNKAEVNTDRKRMLNLLHQQQLST